jgi:beta-alanine degradation protein BauB
METFEMRNKLLPIAVATVFAMSVGHAQVPSGPTAGGTINWKFDDLKFLELAGPGSPQRAIAWGDPLRGAHGFFLRLPVGFESPLHIHTATYHAIVLEGELWNNYDGQKGEIVLGKGGYFSTKSRVPHVTKCLSNVPCVVYVQMDRAFDNPQVKSKFSK